jgi:hypothetical protein
MSETNGEVQETGGLGVTHTPAAEAQPDMRMVVNEGSVVSPSGDDRYYQGGEEITVDATTAVALAMGGHASPVGPAESAPAEAPAAEEVPVEEPPAEEAPAE